MLLFEEDATASTRTGARLLMSSYFPQQNLDRVPQAGNSGLKKHSFWVRRMIPTYVRFVVLRLAMVVNGNRKGQDYYVMLVSELFIIQIRNCCSHGVPYSIKRHGFGFSKSTRYQLIRSLPRRGYFVHAANLLQISRRFLMISLHRGLRRRAVKENMGMY